MANGIPELLPSPEMKETEGEREDDEESNLQRQTTNFSCCPPSPASITQTSLIFSFFQSY